MRVLFIDDEDVNMKGIREYCRINEWDFEWKSFDDDYLQDVLKFDADVIILDWFEGPDEEVGSSIFTSIWENGYRPVIVFSGHADSLNLDDQMKKSNLLKVVVKGDKGEEEICNFLKKYERYFSALSVFRKEVGRTVIEALNVIEPLIQIEEEFIGNDLFKYILSKRMVNAFDIGERKKDLPTWGMYIYPPVSSKITTGDVIRKIDETADYTKAGDPKDYRVVISQSCDIEHDKIKKVVLLECETMKAGLIDTITKDTRTQLSKVPKNDKNTLMPKLIKSKLIGAMNSGFYGRWGVLPELKGVCPDMSVDLKNIETVESDKIGSSNKEMDGKTYYRVTSIDPQYVAQLIWGYMQNACRPGATDREAEKWASKIIDQLENT